MANYVSRFTFKGMEYVTRDAEAYHPITEEVVDGRKLSKENFTTALKEKLEGLGDILTFKGVVANTDALPTTGASKGDLYLVGTASDPDYSEYILKDATAGAYQWERLGSVGSVDLTDYLKTAKVTAWSDAMTAVENTDDVGTGNTAYTLKIPAFRTDGTYA